MTEAARRRKGIGEQEMKQGPPGILLTYPPKLFTRTASLMVSCIIRRRLFEMTVGAIFSLYFPSSSLPLPSFPAVTPSLPFPPSIPPLNPPSCFSPSPFPCLYPYPFNLALLEGLGERYKPPQRGPDKARSPNAFGAFSG